MITVWSLMTVTPKFGTQVYGSGELKWSHDVPRLLTQQTTEWHCNFPSAGSEGFNWLRVFTQHAILIPGPIKKPKHPLEVHRRILPVVHLAMGTVQLVPSNKSCQVYCIVDFDSKEMRVTTLLRRVILEELEVIEVCVTRSRGRCTKFLYKYLMKRRWIH